MIRIVTWNCCRGKPESKLPRLLKRRPDVVAIQECAQPQDLTQGTCAWYGDNRHQGVLALALNRFHVEPVTRRRTLAKLFLPTRVTGIVAFNLLVVWAKPHLRPGRYLDSLYRGIEVYRDFIESDDTVILGDFNSAAYFGEGHLRFVDMLREEFGLFSAYHEYHSLNHGDETHYTYFDRTKKGKPFHIDYCFVPHSWLRRLKRVTVGKHNEWADLSDHVPLIIEISR